ncbi:GNAT family N-acetyltransferase [Micromonospora sp. WMMD1102]|uniref:GNAT family N-acetyltransferase n=1 Tax=Micromonospora sp. WMMD1102 TaxID=3016105 RepID=UPI002414FBFF|nr:GNAT family N-acetyltransferase [Micromonospora sp. WMMD1102]MDG4786469.1 GNAT family N-acetyltransferase [Micromonospora sp. WMMD1102]
MTETVLVRRAGLADARAVAALLGRAGHDEAVLGWVVPDESARRACARSWVEFAPDWLGGLLRTGELLLAGDESNPFGGVAVWEHRTPAPAAATAGPDERQAAFLARAYGRYAPRMVLVDQLISARHPDRRPHWYLQQMVVLPELRGRGLGGAMLRHQLRRADADGIGSYLEASSPRNRALYQRYGFRSCAEPIRLPDGGPTLQPMWREPHPGQPPS